MIASKLPSCALFTRWKF